MQHISNIKVINFSQCYMLLRAEVGAVTSLLFQVPDSQFFPLGQGQESW